MERRSVECEHVEQEFSGHRGCTMTLRFVMMETLDIREGAPPLPPRISVSQVRAADPDAFIGAMQEMGVTMENARARLARLGVPRPRVVRGQPQLPTPVMTVIDPPLGGYTPTELTSGLELFIDVVKKIVLAWASHVVNRTAMLELK